MSPFARMLERAIVLGSLGDDETAALLRVGATAVELVALAECDCTARQDISPGNDLCGARHATDCGWLRTAERCFQ